MRMEARTWEQAVCDTCFTSKLPAGELSNAESQVLMGYRMLLLLSDGLNIKKGKKKSILFNYLLSSKRIEAILQARSFLIITLDTCRYIVYILWLKAKKKCSLLR